MNPQDINISHKIKDNEIEFYAAKDVAPNTSYQIENCIKETLNPTEMEYHFDFMFGDNDNGYFIKDHLKVRIHYGSMIGFTFYTDLPVSDPEIEKIENWIKAIILCLLEKEKNPTQNLDEIAERESEFFNGEQSKNDVSNEGVMDRIFRWFKR